MARFASPDTAALHRLAVAMSDHLMISLDALSGRAVGKGGFFDGLAIGRDCVTATAARVLGWFDAFWPADLPWPDDIRARPSGVRLVAPSVQQLADISHAPIWAGGRRPSWWADLEVRAFLTEAHHQMSTLQAAATGARRFGSRCPKKSAIHVYWQRLDRLYAEKEAA